MNRLLKYIFTTVAALCFALSLTAQQTEDSGPPDSQKNNAPEVRVAPTSDLFTDEIRKARQLHSQWNGLDDELDQARSGALLTDPAVYKRLRSQIDTVLASKRVEIDAWREYYQKSADYWQSTLKSLQSGQPARNTERQDINNMLIVEKRDRDDLHRRLTDLVKTLAEKGVTGEQPAVTDLKKLFVLKEDNVAKLEQVLHLFDSGVQHLDKRRELARSRSLEARQLLRSVDVERPLWEALYSGKAHRLDLDFHVTIPKP